MLAAIGAHLCGDIPQLLVYEPEAPHSAVQCLARRWICKDYFVHPTAELVAPMVIIKLLGNSNAKIQQLHFYKALDTPVILNQIVSSSEKTAQLLPLHMGNVNTLKSAILELSTYQLGIYFIGLGKTFLSLAVDVGRVHYQGMPAVCLKTTMGVIAATTCFISCSNLMVGKMFGYILV